MLRIALLILALAAGGGAAYVALQLSRDPVPDKATTARPTTAMQDVLVAATDLGLGQALTKENMRWVSVPENTLGPGDIVRSARPDALDGLTNWLVRSRIGAGEPIRDAKLIPSTGSFLATVLPSGMRAVAVRISAENTAGGFILPGDRVDVLVTAAPLIGANGTQRTNMHVTRTILSNVLVLAIDQTVDDKSKDDKDKGKAGVIGHTATLELDPLQVEQLATAQAMGAISLALRSVADNGETSVPLRTRTTNTISRVRIGSIEVVRIARSAKPPDETFDSPYELAPDAK
jgi:pilus assembly protein CpaB